MEQLPRGLGRGKILVLIPPLLSGRATVFRVKHFEGMTSVYFVSS
jgi:hypothetical protein